MSLVEQHAQHDRYRLAEEVLARSIADDWDDAKLEWELAWVYRTEELGACICGHPIREHCVLVNQLTGTEIIVGNVCVKKFLDIPVDQLFGSLDRISRDPLRSMSVGLIE